MSKTRGSRVEQHSTTRNRRQNSEIDLENPVPEEQKQVPVDAVLPEDAALGQ